MKSMSRQHIPVFWRNYVPLIERDGVVEQMLADDI